MIKYDDFAKLDIRIGKILSAERIPNSDKLLKLSVDIGGETRTICAGVAEFYQPEELVGKLVPILANLEPRKLKGVMSEGMTLMAGDESATDANGEKTHIPILLLPAKEVQPGSRVL